MRSGAQIYLKVLASENPCKAVRKLKNGPLRSLLQRLDHPHGEPPCDKRDQIHGLALVESSRRWVKQRRKGSIL